MGHLALTRALAVVSVTVMPQQLSSSRVILTVVSVPVSLESMGQTVDSVLLDTGTMDLMAARVSVQRQHLLNITAFHCFFSSLHNVVIANK